ncbi:MULTISPECIES: 7-cyano-7-deazaguanine synthase [Amycolatopsis]|uniref:7-cyano-7-deazaguanine synthase n=1 Tax=Amycolatopsis albidoflavus TaxID=102226 RepID=A0ABW5HQH6_9PSEU
MGTGMSSNRTTTGTASPGEILLCGGGIDSFVAWHYLGRPQALYFDLGDRNRDQEYRALDTLARRHGIRLAVSRELDLGSWELQDGVIPLRQLHLVALACHRADTVWCVAVKRNRGADKSSVTFERLSELISQAVGRQVRVDSPFRDMTKTEVVRWYVDQSLPVDDLICTHSCMKPKNTLLHCGRCVGCVRRWVALANNGIEAPFAEDPWRWEQVQEDDGRHDDQLGSVYGLCIEELQQARSSVGIRASSPEGRLRSR